MELFSTWAELAEALRPLPRGAKSRLAKALAMDASQLNRNLKTNRDLQVGQAKAAALLLENFDDEFEPRTPVPSPGNRVAVYGFAAASNNDRIAINPGEIMDWVDLPMGLSLRGEYFVVKVIGASMEPRLFEGEMILIQRYVPPIRDRDVLIEFNDGTGIVKTYRGQKAGRVFAHQYNPDEDISYDATSVKNIMNVFCRL